MTQDRIAASMSDNHHPSDSHLHGRAALVGMLLSLATLPVHLVLDARHSIEFSGVVVAAIGAIYVGFALQKGTVRQIAVEAIVATFFFAIALAGLWWNPWVIPAGYVAHGLWDAYHHVRSRDLVPIPTWYPAFCAAFDWLYAAGLSVIWLTVVPL
jgi:hypothetical protein